MSTTLTNQAVTSRGVSDSATVVSTVTGEVTETTVGAGVATQAGAVPDAQAQQAAAGVLAALNFQSLLASINEKLPRINNDDTAVLILQVASAIDKNQKLIQEESVKNASAKRRDDIAEYGDKLRKALEAQEKAASKSFFGKLFSRIASYISGALMVAVGGALAATGVATLAGGIMIGVGALMIADQITKDATGSGIGAKLGRYGDLVFSLGLAAASVAAAALTGGSTLATAVTATSSVINGAVQVASAGINLDAALAQVDATERQAETKEFEAKTQAEQSFTDLVLQILVETSKRINGIIDAGSEAINERGNVLSRAKLTA
ncbi:type III secretion system translocon subunit SctE [Pseudochelatococcus lubricantis]|uniref:type III secretion system translocon subunit SctE n=1 Tax=Pseudochelatococcus lubricantis TaxID=1538102 RepID=UPI0035E4B402